MITIFKCTSSHTLLNGCSSRDLFILICRHTFNLYPQPRYENNKIYDLVIIKSTHILKTFCPCFGGLGERGYSWKFNGQRSKWLQLVSYDLLTVLNNYQTFTTGMSFDFLEQEIVIEPPNHECKRYIKVVEFSFGPEIRSSRLLPASDVIDIFQVGNHD